MSSPDGQLEDVRRFYDHWSPQFLAGFGPTFQAGFLKEAETSEEDPDTSTRLMAQRAGIGPGQRVLDAGCGVGGPAMGIASAFPDVQVYGVTISAVQASMARGLVVGAGLQRRVSILPADYHRLPFAGHSFDAAVFFESIGYSPDVRALMREVARVVRPGGRLYIKDVFAPAPPLTAIQERDLEAFDRLWHLARSPTIPGVEDALHRAGCEILASGAMANVGNARFLRAMIEFDPVTLFRVNALGRAFSLKTEDLPTFFGEVVARVPP